MASILARYRPYCLPLFVIVSNKDFKSITSLCCDQPHSILGMHPLEIDRKLALVVRAYFPDAINCEVIDNEVAEDTRYKLEKIGNNGFFEGIIDRSDLFRYQLFIEATDSKIHQSYDPYSFPPTLSEEDICRFTNGKDSYAHHKLGAHLRVHNNIEGVSFAVWAPNAQRVSVIGDFNNWDGRHHMMRMLNQSGIWEIFIPEVLIGSKYKFEIATHNNITFQKTDPYGLEFEAPPHNSSIVCSINSYRWKDNKWIHRRNKTDWLKEPISIYEMHLGSWRCDAGNDLTYKEIARDLIEYLQLMKYTHVEFMPLAEYPFDGSWGYQVTGYFSPTNRFGKPQEFKFLIDELHQNGFGVIMDWVPAHFPKDSFALAQFDGSALYEYEDPRKGLHQDWGTLIFNFERKEVCSFLISSAIAWCEHYHIDGLRVDAVASMLYLDYSRKEGEWIPNSYGGRENLEAIEFLKGVNDAVHQHYPGTLMIAEESTAFPGVTAPTKQGGLGFDLKWNMGWMHDTLDYMQKDTIGRQEAQDKLSFGMLYQYSECFTQVFSHDEVVHEKKSMLEKMPGESLLNKAKQLRCLYGFMWMWPGKKTLFMGCDFGQSSEWRYKEFLDWHLLDSLEHSGIQSCVRDLNQIYQEIPSIAEMDYNKDGFEWINHSDSKNCTLSFLRKGHKAEDTLLVVGNFSSEVLDNYRLAIPLSGRWEEIFNSDSKKYGGLQFFNSGSQITDMHNFDGRDYSILLSLLPHTISIFRWQNRAKK